MKELLKKDLNDTWNTVPPASLDKIKNVNCHKFILYIIGKISFDEMVYNPNSHEDEGLDFIFGEKARIISDVQFTQVEDLESLYELVGKSCEAGEVYVGQILDLETKEVAHSFLIKHMSDTKYTCFDKPGFKYPFKVHEIRSIFDFINKDGEKPYHNQQWRFIPTNLGLL